MTNKLNSRKYLRDTILKIDLPKNTFGDRTEEQRRARKNSIMSKKPTITKYPVY